MFLSSFRLHYSALSRPVHPCPSDPDTTGPLRRRHPASDSPRGLLRAAPTCSDAISDRPDTADLAPTCNKPQDRRIASLTPSWYSIGFRIIRYRIGPADICPSFEIVSWPDQEFGSGGAEGLGAAGFAGVTDFSPLPSIPS